jgi:hypothetical protein
VSIRPFHNSVSRKLENRSLREATVDIGIRPRC